MYTNKITELDFQGINGKKNLGHYFKILFLEDPCLMPIEAKEKFHDKFPNIDISTKENDTYIRTQYRIIKKIHTEKIKNTDTLFQLLNKEGKNLSTVIKYDSEDLI